MEHGLEHLLGAGSMLDHCALWSQIASQYCDASVGSDGFIIGADNILPGHIDAITLIKFLKPLVAPLIESVVL